METQNSNMEPNDVFVTNGNWIFWFDRHEPLGEQFMAAPLDPTTGQAQFHKREKVDCINASPESTQFFAGIVDAIIAAQKGN